METTNGTNGIKKMSATEKGIWNRQRVTDLLKGPKMTQESMSKVLGLSKSAVARHVADIREETRARSELSRKGSALDKVVEAMSGKEREDTHSETLLRALIQFIGVQRAEIIIKEERTRIELLIGGAK